MKACVTSTIGLLLLTGMLQLAAGADPPSVPDKVLNELDFMVGKWEVVAAESTDPMRTLSDERVWAPGKQCLIFTWTGERDGVKVHASAISGWNQTKNQVTEHWYSSDGAWFEVCYPVDKMKDGVWEGTMSWIEPDGKKVAGTCRLEKGKDEFTWIAEWTDGGKKQSIKSVTRKIGK